VSDGAVLSRAVCRLGAEACRALAVFADKTLAHLATQASSSHGFDAAPNFMDRLPEEIAEPVAALTWLNVCGNDGQTIAARQQGGVLTVAAHRLRHEPPHSSMGAPRDLCLELAKPSVRILAERFRGSRLADVALAPRLKYDQLAVEAWEALCGPTARYIERDSAVVRLDPPVRIVTRTRASRLAEYIRDTIVGCSGRLDHEV
jgi:hypothetical protein